uniref:NAD-dependent epimerase/dehydratase family protein n=1 Tax=Algoriphagus sp. TaxID=1872435 RepID=UPI00404858BA
MKSIFLTGSSGFVGKNLIAWLSNSFYFFRFQKGTIPKIEQDIVIHLAGKSHDLKKVSNFSDYYHSNTELTKFIFDAFLASEAKVFIFLSSVKAVSDEIDVELTEVCIPNPKTLYGKSKLLAEQYILSKKIPDSKRIYILRPCIIHGSFNKGNLNNLFKYISLGFPWLLGSFDNLRSYCSIENLIFVIKKLIQHKEIPSGIYNIADDEPISTNELISIMFESQNIKPRIFYIPKRFIMSIAKIGNFFNFPLNEENLHKLTSSYIVSNDKIKRALRSSLPVSSKEGLFKSFRNFN